jgi:prolyl-tRNA synthetase
MEGEETILTADEIKYGQRVEAAVKAAESYLETQQKRLNKVAAETEKFIEDHLKHEDWWEFNKERLLSQWNKGKFKYLKAPQRGY